MDTMALSKSIHSRYTISKSTSLLLLEICGFSVFSYYFFLISLFESSFLKSNRLCALGNDSFIYLSRMDHRPNLLCWFHQQLLTIYQLFLFALFVSSHFAVLHVMAVGNLQSWSFLLLLLSRIRPIRSLSRTLKYGMCRKYRGLSKWPHGI